VAGEICIVIFPSTHAAIRAERAAKEAGLKTRMIPVPREISSDCNVGMEASIDDMARLRCLLACRDIECDVATWPKPPGSPGGKRGPTPRLPGGDGTGQGQTSDV
jgi:hypothetical protein